MAISSSVISSFSAPKRTGVMSSRFIRGGDSNVGSLISNISPSNKTTSGFLNTFGSEKTEKALGTNVRTLRNTLLDTFEISKILVTAIKEISNALKGLGLSGSRGGGPNQLNTLLGVGGGIGLGGFGIRTGQNIIRGKRPPGVTGDVTGDVASKSKKVVNASTNTPGNINLRPKSKGGFWPNLRKMTKSRWFVPGVISGSLLLWLGSALDANAAEGSEEHSLSELSSSVDKFSSAIASLKNEKGNKTLNKNSRIIFDRLVAGGLTTTAAAGIVANLGVESNFNPSTEQLNGGPGRGLAQWEKGGRFDTDPINLVDFAKSKGRSWDDLETQIDFILHEMSVHPEYISVRKELNAASSISEATKIFLNNYEKAGIPHLDRRLSIGTEIKEAGWLTKPQVNKFVVPTGDGKSKVIIVPFPGPPPPIPDNIQNQSNMNIPTSSGNSPDLAFLPPGKSDSFESLESRMIYNIVG